MDKSTAALLPAIRLEYSTGELIVKEGDYGISIYQIVEGKIGIYIESSEENILINTLGPGEFIGEMIFLTGYNARRSATIRALENSVLEAWHPSRITQEYEAMPFIIRYITNQTVNYLTRTNQMISKFAEEKKEKKAPPPKALDQPVYGKIVDIDCLYKPVNGSEDVRLWGRVKDIGNSGLRFDVKRVNTFDYSHKIGDEFLLTAFLTNDKKAAIKGKIISSRKLENNRFYSLEMEYLEVSQATKTVLGFYLL